MTDYVDFYNNVPLADGTTLRYWLEQLEDPSKTEVIDAMLKSPACRLCELDAAHMRSRAISHTLKTRIYLLATLVLRRLGINIEANGQVGKIEALDRQFDHTSSYNANARKETMNFVGRLIAALFVIKAIRIAVVAANHAMQMSTDLLLMQKVKQDHMNGFMLSLTPAIDVYYNRQRNAFEADAPPFNRHLDPAPVEWRFRGIHPYYTCVHGLLLLGPESSCPILRNLEHKAMACRGRR